MNENEEELDGLDDPFAKEGPTEYERWLYKIQEMHAGIIVALMARVNRIESLLVEQERMNIEANKAAFSVPDVPKDEKPH